MQRLELPDLETPNSSRQMTHMASADPSDMPPSPAAETRRVPQGMWVHIAALSLSLFWIGGAGGFVYGLYGLAGLLRASPLLQVQLVAGLLLPVAFIWMVALTLRRAQELSATAATLANIALHLSQPEDSAAREVTRLGHAVRRQVDGLETAIGGVATKITALEEEIYQHTENLTRTSDKAEERIEAVRAMLSREREELESLTKQLDGQGGALTETLKGQTQALTEASTLAFDKIQGADTVLKARMEAFEGTASTASQTSQKASRELDHQCAKLEAVADAALTRADIIAGRYDKQRAAIGEATEKLAQENAKLEAGFERQRDLLAQVAELAAGEARRIEEAISLSARELEGAIEGAAGRASAVGDDFKQQAQSVRIGADEAAAALTRAAQSATQATDTACAAIKARAAQMATTISEAGVQANNAALHSHASFEEYAEALQQSIEKSGDALEQASRGVMSKLDSQLSTLAEQISGSSAAVDRAASQAVQTTKAHLESKFEEIRSQLASTQHWVGEAVDQVHSSLGEIGGSMNSSVHAMLSDTKSTLEEGAAHLQSTLTESSDQLRLGASSIRHDMETEAETLREHISQMAQGTGQATADAMNATQSAIDMRFSEIRDQLSSAHHSIDDTARHLSTKMDEVSQRIGEAATDAMTKAGESFGNGTQSLEADIAKAGQAARDAASHAQTTFDQHVKEIETRLENTGNLIDRAAQTSREKLGVYVQDIQNEITAAGELVDGSTDNLAAAAARIKTAASDAGGHLESALKDLDSHMAQFPERAKQSAHHIREVIEEQLKTFTEVAENTAARAHVLDKAFQTRLKAQYDTLGELLGGGALVTPGPVAPSLAQTPPSVLDPRQTETQIQQGPSENLPNSSNLTPRAQEASTTPAARAEAPPEAPETIDVRGEAETGPVAIPAPEIAESSESREPREPVRAQPGLPEPDQTRAQEDESAPPDRGDYDGLAKRLARRLRQFGSRDPEDGQPPVPTARLDLAITAGPEEKADRAGAAAAAAAQDTASSAPETISPEPTTPDLPDTPPETTPLTSPLQRLKAIPNMRWREILAAVETGADDESGTTYTAPSGASSPDVSRTSLHAIETLQALTVDLDRALETDPPVDLVQSYVNGDRNLFAKRLVSMKQDDLFERISFKYKNDAEFQSYADSYMTQFEDLLKGAVNKDREDILAETYLSSDTGKLYLLLAQALDRKA